MLKGDAVPPLKWGVADEDGLVKFLVEEKSFSEERIRKVIEKVNASRSKATQGDTSLDLQHCMLLRGKWERLAAQQTGLWCRAPGVLLWASDREVVDGRRQAQGAAQARQEEGLHREEGQGWRGRRWEGRWQDEVTVSGMLVGGCLKQRLCRYAVAQKLCPMNLPKLV